MTITVKGEDVQVPVTNFGQSADQSGAEDGSYQLIPGADVKTGIGFNLGIKDTVDGRVAYGYNVWGQWVKNEAYRVGNLEVNDFNLFAGALQINPDRADDIYQGLVGGIYNIQIVTGNQAILDQYPTPEAFLQAAQSGAEFTNLNIPQYYPETTNRNLYNHLATVNQVEKMRLDIVRIGFQEQSYDQILHPTNPYRSFFSHLFDDSIGSVADARVGTTENDRVSGLTLTFGRVKQISPFECFSTLQIETSKDQLVDSANQLLEMWIYATHSILDYPDNYLFVRQYYASDLYPYLYLSFPLYDLDKENPGQLCRWNDTDLILPNQ
jgi:hypothetical protein